MPDFELEQAVRERANNSELVVCGVDEVGVGCLAGPVIAAAVVLDPIEPPSYDWVPELNDSKKLTWRKRQHLHEIIMNEAVAVGVGYATAEEIDDVGISSARRRAVLKAFQECRETLGDIELASVVDDRRLGWLRADLGGKASIFSDRADSKSYSCAAASIVAKVIRDNYMTIQGNKYAIYNWAKNKGYGSPEHLRALETHGPCRLHRKTFKRVKEFVR